MNIEKWKYLKSKKGIAAISYVSVIIIGVLDYITTSDFSFSIFYIIPIAFLALNTEANRLNIIFLSIISTILWFVSDFNSRNYEVLFFPIWNSIVRLCIFLLIGITLLKYKESNKQLKELNRKLLEINEEKNRTIGIAAHDLRSPTSMIINLIGYLRDDAQLTLTPDIQEIFNSLHNISQNSLNMINNLLDISKIELGKIELKLTDCDYILFMREQLAYNNLIAKNKNITISMQCEYNSINVKMDKTYMIQAINNLLSNAVKFSERGSEVIVKISRTGNSTILTEVIDFGKGIKREEQKYLFTYFQKTSTISTEGEKNTGLGLAIVKKIIQAHNGNIWVISDYNRGATFCYTLLER